MSIVERYLDAVRTHDWDALRQCLTDDVVRIGPFRDEYRGRAAYVEFLERLMPSLPGYSMEVTLVVPATDRRTYVELSETVTFDGAPHVTEEVLVFDLAGDGRIERIDIYIKTGPPAQMPQ